MSGQWTGGSVNRQWIRPGSRVTDLPGDRARGVRLAAELATARFWCETCGGVHPLAEHRACRRRARSAR